MLAKYPPRGHCDGMQPDLHARIQTFLQQLRVQELSPSAGWDGEGGGTRGCLLPFLAQTGHLRRYYLMKPQARHKHLEPPLFQLCKGKRMTKRVGGWKDAEEGDEGMHLESLPATALREGIEELGLRLDAIESLHAAGGYMFDSVSGKERRRLWLMAALMRPQAEFDEPDADAADTESCTWLTLDEFAACGRKDHIDILRDVDAQLGGQS